MALIGCFTGPQGQQGLQGVLTCLRDTEGMTGILVVVALLAAWIVVQYVACARRERRMWESRPGKPSLSHNLVMPVMQLLCMTLQTGIITRRCWPRWKKRCFRQAMN
ncbi:hypothetical protein AB9K28_02775 [Enterobacter asburiae]